MGCGKSSHPHPNPPPLRRGGRGHPRCSDLLIRQAERVVAPPPALPRYAEEGAVTHGAFHCLSRSREDFSAGLTTKSNHTLRKRKTTSSSPTDGKALNLDTDGESTKPPPRRGRGMGGGRERAVTYDAVTCSPGRRRGWLPPPRPSPACRGGSGHPRSVSLPQEKQRGFQRWINY